MELLELEVITARLLDQQKELKSLEEEISRLEIDLRELPRKSAAEKNFYSLIGMDWDEPKLQEKLKELSERKNSISNNIADENARIIMAISDKELKLPLDPRPITNGAMIDFKYRDNSTYSKAIQKLADILGLAVPIKVDNVTIGFDKISVGENDTHYAMERVATAFDKISKTVSLKLKDNPKG